MVLRKLAVLLCLPMLVASPRAEDVHTPAGTHGQSPPRDYSITIFAIGNWAGAYGYDDEGRGGLAALHTLVERERYRLSTEGGRAILLHSGRFTGAESAAGFQEELVFDELALDRYLKIDALGLSPEEVAFAHELRSDPDLGRLPVVAANLRGTIDPAHPFRVVAHDQYRTLISSIANGSEPAYLKDLAKQVHHQFVRNHGADLYVLMVDRLEGSDAAAETHPLPRENDPHEEETPAPKPRLNGSDLLKPGALELFFAREAHEARPDPVTLPSDRPFAQRFLIIESSARENFFRRLESGPYVCSIANRSVCEVRIRMRGHRLLAVEQRFIDLNSVDRATSWIPPDPLLQRVLGPIKPRTESNDRPTSHAQSDSETPEEQTQTIDI